MIRRLNIPKYKGGKPSATDLAFALTSDQEGFRPQIYWDSIGRRNTVGYGFTANEDMHTWTKNQADLRLRGMIKNYDRILRTSDIASQYEQMTPKQQAALMDLLHQGGTGVLRRMPKFVSAIRNGDMIGAYNELDWGKEQTKRRYNARRAYFADGIETPQQVANNKIKQDLINQGVRDAINVQNNILLPVERYDDPQTPRSISWTAAYPKERKIRLHPLFNLPDLKSLIEQQIFQPSWTAQ